ncbi:GGDEF domain-containing protein [Agarivorans aestuarii]|uniref:diguanylate cyclase n=1 Tax=Agarivorans aestuarii TaxID=1563703 RepID=A0ABU7G915_9ALTE|nr:GGDEF domain-containing protein [Agarivorans aestuarii]MEE1675884.1 GGDEF domain-containing protein [Agarivorans aestuarii]
MQQPQVMQAWRSVFMGFSSSSQERQFANWQWQQQRQHLSWVQALYCLCVISYLFQSGSLSAWWQQANIVASFGLSAWLCSQILVTWLGLRLVKARSAHTLLAAHAVVHFSLVFGLMHGVGALQLGNVPDWLVYSLPLLFICFYLPILLAVSLIVTATLLTLSALEPLSPSQIQHWPYVELPNTLVNCLLVCIIVCLCHALWRHRYTHEQGLDLFQEKEQPSSENLPLFKQSIDTDQLTGYANFARFKQFSEIEIERTSRYQNAYSIVLINVNHFSRYRDKLGADEADKLLVKLANFLQSKIRKVDLLARCEKDQFVIGLPESSLYQALDTAERIHDALGSEFWLNYLDDLELGSRLGVACVDNTANNVESLMNKAENAMNNHRSASALSYGR